MSVSLLLEKETRITHVAKLPRYLTVHFHSHSLSVEECAAPRTMGCVPLCKVLGTAKKLFCAVANAHWLRQCAWLKGLSALRARFCAP